MDLNPYTSEARPIQQRRAAIEKELELAQMAGNDHLAAEFLTRLPGTDQDVKIATKTRNPDVLRTLMGD